MRPAGFERADALRVWAVHDGKPGHANQALGLAEAIARKTRARLSVKRIGLRTPHRWAPPQFVFAPRAALSLDSDAFDPPWPDLYIGCGRETVPFAMGLRDWSGGTAFVVQLQDPRVNPREFDLVLAPAHDGLEGPHVAPTLGALNRITPERLAEAAAAFPRDLAALPSPRLAVLIGGASRRQTISARRAALIAASLSPLAQTGASLLVSLSRRTPPPARRVLEAQLRPLAALWFDGEGPNPYLALLAAAEHVAVTADSVSMAAEAAAAGKPVHVLEVDGRPGKLAQFHAALALHGAARPFRLPLAGWSYAPLGEADRCADRVLAALQARANRGANPSA